jgi:mRNA-degrading endonuclease toxin of MazEF toxin-antitoxin module
MKTQTKLIALVAVGAIAAGADDHPNAVAEFVQARALPSRVALDTSGAVAQALGNVHVTPTTYRLDRSGRIVARYVGEPDWQDFHARIERALADPA